MRKIAVLFSCAMMALCVACQPVQRGIQDGALVSSNDPALRVAAPSLPLKTAGFVTARLDGTSEVSGLAVDVWLAVYGAQNAAAPVAIVAHAELPEAWQWDHDSTPPFSGNKGAAVIGGTGFQSCTFIVEGQRDAFAQLAGQDGQQMRWLARRFAARSAFGREKLTMEYREPLPAGEKAVHVADVSNATVSAFEKRAEAAFVASPYAPVSLDKRQAVQGVAVQYLGRNFLGNASFTDMWHSPRD